VDTSKSWIEQIPIQTNPDARRGVWDMASKRRRPAGLPYSDKDLNRVPAAASQGAKPSVQEATSNRIFPMVGEWGIDRIRKKKKKGGQIFGVCWVCPIPQSTLTCIRIAFGAWGRVFQPQDK